jgi:hypothetical protein
MSCHNAGGHNIFDHQKQIFLITRHFLDRWSTKKDSFDHQTFLDRNDDQKKI